MERIFEYESSYYTHTNDKGHELCNLWKVTVELKLGYHEYEVEYFIRGIQDVDANCARKWEELCPEERKDLDKCLQGLADDAYDDLVIDRIAGEADRLYDEWRDGELTMNVERGDK